MTVCTSSMVTYPNRMPLDDRADLQSAHLDPVHTLRRTACFRRAHVLLMSECFAPRAGDYEIV